MMHKLKEKIQRKFIYKIKDHIDEDLFLNSVYLIDENKKSDPVLGDFLNYCEEHEVSPTNFILKKDGYEILTKDVNITDVVIPLNKFGLHWKHRVIDNLNDITLKDIYNLIIDNKNISYSYRGKDFLWEFIYPDEYFTNEYEVHLDRKTEFLLKDYLSLGFYDYDISIEKINNTNSEEPNFKIITSNSMSKAVFTDFLYFYENNKVECPTCKKLVNNAFDEYMIQFYKHDGC